MSALEFALSVLVDVAPTVDRLPAGQEMIDIWSG